MAVSVIRLSRLRRALMHVVAVTGAVATMVAAVRAGPTGWNGPWSDSGSMVRLFSQPLAGPSPPPATPAGAVRVTLAAASVVPASGIEVLRDGFLAGRVGAVPAILMVHAADRLTLVDDGHAAVWVRVAADPPLASPHPGPWRVPARGQLRLPPVTLAAAGGPQHP